jgi:hypothetical protein
VALELPYFSFNFSFGGRGGGGGVEGLYTLENREIFSSNGTCTPHKNGVESEVVDSRPRLCNFTNKKN